MGYCDALFVVCGLGKGGAYGRNEPPDRGGFSLSRTHVSAPPTIHFFRIFLGFPYSLIDESLTLCYHIANYG